ncbi:MAG: AAA family ATPase [Candidatus Hodarchaeota archaeon]
MKIVSIDIQNFKPFRKLTLPDDDSELPRGLILVRGPNSTGKTSLFEAILWALWGPDAVELTNDELVSFASSFCKVVLIFEVAGVRYKIDRSYDQASGMSVILYIDRDNVWKKQSDKSRSVSRDVEGILNLELNQALNTLLVRQGEVALIANATPSVLRKLLVRVYNIELLSQMTNHLEHLESDLKARIRGLEDDYIPPKSIREDIERSKDKAQRLKTSVGEKEKEMKAAEKQLKGLPDPKDIKTLYDLFQDLERREHEHDQSIKSRDLELGEAGIADADSRIVSARSSLLRKESKRLEKERADAEKTITTIDREIGEINGISKDLDEKIETLESSASDDDSIVECPTCSKPLTAEERVRLVSEYRDAVKSGKIRVIKMNTERVRLKAEIVELENRIRTTIKATDAVGRVKEKQKEVDRAKAQVEKAAKKLGQRLAKMDVENIDKLLEKHVVRTIMDLRDKITNQEMNLRSLKRECDTIRENIVEEESRIEELEGKELLMVQRGAEIEELKRVDEHAKYVRRKLVNGFISDYVFQKRLIGIIRSATNQYVRSFTNDQYTSIDLEPTPEKGRSGAGVQLKIWDERDKARKKTSQLSFGDRTAISLGLRLGISRTMSSIRPLKDSPIVAPRVRCVLLDEPLGGLDKGRRTSVVQNLVNDESFEQIFLITHTDVQGWEGMPVIEISKSGSTSAAVLTKASQST